MSWLEYGWHYKHTHTLSLHSIITIKLNQAALGRTALSFKVDSVILGIRVCVTAGLKANRDKFVSKTKLQG